VISEGDGRDARSFAHLCDRSNVFVISDDLYAQFHAASLDLDKIVYDRCTLIETGDPHVPVGGGPRRIEVENKMVSELVRDGHERGGTSKSNRPVGGQRTPSIGLTPCDLTFSELRHPDMARLFGGPGEG
jgi:hypothetical protein